MLPVTHVLFATDLSDSSKYAFHIARAIKRDYGAKLTIIHVVLPPVIMGGDGFAPPPAPVNFDLMEKELAKLESEVSPPVEHLLIEGDAVTEILNVAKEKKVDMIVLGTHGRTGLGRMLIGSVAEQVLRRATCPVLTVKTPDKKSD